MNRRPHPLALGLLVPLIGALLLAAFAWPNVRSAPDGVPLVVAGAGAAVSGAAERLSSSAPGAFDIERVADRDSAEQAVRDRDAYGAVVLDQPPTVLVASGASPAVAQLLTGVAATLDAQVVDLAPLPADDRRGAGIASAVLPMLLTAGLLALAAIRLVTTVTGRLTVLAVGVPVGALTLTAVLQGWLGALDGPFLTNAGVLAAGLLAAGAVLVGLQAVAGAVGLGLGYATLFLLGNPLSGATSAPELLPSGWSTLGSLLPPGATVQALRGTAFFDGAGTTGPILVLLTWIAAGLALVAAGTWTARRRGIDLRQPEAPVHALTSA